MQQEALPQVERPTRLQAVDSAQAEAVPLEEAVGRCVVAAAPHGVGVPDRALPRAEEGKPAVPPS